MLHSILVGIGGTSFRRSARTMPPAPTPHAAAAARLSAKGCPDRLPPADRLSVIPAPKMPPGPNHLPATRPEDQVDRLRCRRSVIRFAPLGEMTKNGAVFDHGHLDPLPGALMSRPIRMASDLISDALFQPFTNWLSLKLGHCALLGSLIHALGVRALILADHVLVTPDAAMRKSLNAGRLALAPVKKSIESSSISSKQLARILTTTL